LNEAPSPVSASAPGREQSADQHSSSYYRKQW
jgi:hypothetical protein